MNELLYRDGKMDFLRVYDYALSAEQIAELYALSQ